MCKYKLHFVIIRNKRVKTFLPTASNCIDVKSLLVENLFLWKTSLIKEKLLLEENLPDHRKVPWSWKNLCLWKTFLIVEKSLVVKNVLDRGKGPWSWKSLCLWKNFLAKFLGNKVQRCIQDSRKLLKPYMLDVC